jgi:hypothetical protein
VLEVFGIVATRETELRHVEPIELSFYEMTKDVYYVSARFREQDAAVAFDVEGMRFSPV